MECLLEYEKRLEKMVLSAIKKTFFPKALTVQNN
jgi:hypothetical protein